ncbi:MAG: GGDEF domain-containing protein [Desulfocapsa sp.]|nr:GGDEF domain-containing protein [Desulfocapsa sp.]
MANNEKNTLELRQDLIRFHSEADLNLTFVAGEAGDHDLNNEERRKHNNIRKQRGEKFFVDLLFILTHKTYSTEYAERLWKNIVQHKDVLTGILGRNPGICVAAHDFLLNILGDLKHLVIIEESKIAEVTTIAIKDGLSGLYDHATFQTKLIAEIVRCKRYSTNVSLIMLDIDHFKQYNDKYGHQRGDQMICKIARLLADDCRDIDIPCRYGGEEFAVILPETSGKDAFKFAERLRQHIETKLQKEKITVSLGVASFPEDAGTKQALISASDKALFHAKAAGRNKTMSAHSSSS